MRTFTEEQKERIDAQVEEYMAEKIFEQIYDKELKDEWYGCFQRYSIALEEILKEHYNNNIAANMSTSLTEEQSQKWLGHLGFETICYSYNYGYFVFKISGDPIPTRY